MRTFALFICFTMLLITSRLGFAEDASQLMQAVYDLPRVDDQSSKLTFTFTEPNKNDAKIVMYLLWRSEKKGSDYSAKMILFPIYPPNQKGKNYMTWLREPGSEKNSADWLYLPELRKIMRLSAKGHAHQHDHNSDDEMFFRSVINRTHMDPRDPALDDHHILNEETIENRHYYIVESKPIKFDTKYPYKRTLSWVEKGTNLVHQKYYFDQNNQLNLTMNIDWVEKKSRWVWKHVVARSIISNAKTILDIDSIKVNSGLKENTFSKRTLKRTPFNF